MKHKGGWMELIQKEANRTDDSADEKLISACMDLMECLQGREHVENALIKFKSWW